MCLCLMLTMAGCAPGSGAGDSVPLTMPVVVDMTAARCVKADAAARREATLTVQAPKPDTVSADGRPAISKGRWKAKTDESRAAIVRKNATIKRLIDEADVCVDGPAPAAATS